MKKKNYNTFFCQLQRGEMPNNVHPFKTFQAKYIITGKEQHSSFQSKKFIA